MLPAGRNVVSGKDDGEVVEVEVEIKAGELTEVRPKP